MTGIILIFIGIILIVMNVKAIKQSTSFDLNLENQIKNTGDYDLKIGALREEFAETILEMQEEIDKLSKNTNTYKNGGEINDNNSEKAKGENIDIVANKDDDIKNKDQSVKISEVKKMYDDGYTVDDISEKLNLGKGEVLLIQKLYIN